MAADGWTLKAVARRALRTMGLEVRRAPGEASSHYSHLDEQEVVRRSLARLDVSCRFCVDIAASDGTTMSNTYALFDEGWAGVAAECDAQKFSRLAEHYVRFPDVCLARCMVTPDNVLALLQATATPKEFGFLNLDIDGYDYFVLDRILHQYRPRLICVEINEKIPPPIKFAVRWDSRYAWAGDHFYGASISKMHELCVAHHYALTELHYNSAFMIPEELFEGTSLSPEQAWCEGYRDKADRQRKFPWNSDMDDLLTMSAADVLTSLRERFRERDGMYELHL